LLKIKVVMPFHLVQEDVGEFLFLVLIPILCVSFERTWRILVARYLVK